jgi:hypothetical protein
MPGKRVQVGLLVTGAALVLSLPAAAPGAVTLGSDLAAEPNGSTSCSSMLSDRGCLAVDDRLPGDAILEAPSDGVIVRWRVRLGDGTGAQQIRIRTMRRIDADQFTAIFTGELEDIPAGAGTYTFAARLPISGGDQVGLEADSGINIEWRAPLLGAQAFEYGSPPPADGEDSPPPAFTDPDQEHTFNADVERDADGDGFGDETQDRCPTDASTQGTCRPDSEPPDTDPPETTITKGAPNKLNKDKLKFRFVSDEANSTFECKLKVKPFGGKRHTRPANFKPAKFKACQSPRKLKDLGAGKYQFKVRATDAADNVDPSPAKDKFKIVG